MIFKPQRIQPQVEKVDSERPEYKMGKKTSYMGAAHAKLRIFFFETPLPSSWDSNL